jgi:AraC-like DNA-binding protein
MKLTFIEPRPELKTFIESLWLFESPIGMPSPDIDFSAPDGHPKLVIPVENSITAITNGQIQAGYDRDVYFVGNRDSATLLRTTQQRTLFIGIEFYPHGAYPILGVPMGELTNRRLPAEVLFPKWGREVSEMVRNKVHISEKIDCIQSHLIALLQERDRHNPVVRFCAESLKNSNGLITVRDLERRTGYSSRYLEMLFTNHVGLSPKALGRIYRFQRFYKRWAAGEIYGTLKSELYDYYYDQAHFTKEFKRMTTFSPEHFMSKVVNEFGRQLARH